MQRCSIQNRVPICCHTHRFVEQSVFIHSAVSRGISRWKRSKHKQFFDKLGKKLGYKELDDRYNVTKSDIIKNEGKDIFNSCSSLADAVLEAYPDHNWLPWKFGHTPRGYW